jgi:hypothetical protein
MISMAGRVCMQLAQHAYAPALRLFGSWFSKPARFLQLLARFDFDSIFVIYCMSLCLHNVDKRKEKEGAATITGWARRSSCSPTVEAIELQEDEKCCGMNDARSVRQQGSQARRGIGHFRRAPS